MKHTGFIAAIIATAGLVGGTAVAAKSGSEKHGPRMTFEQIDLDGDGQITQAEIEAMKAARFDAADANGDGKLTLEEMQAQGHKKAAEKAAAMLEKHDADGDGALSKEELPKPRRSGRMFERMDADGNGSISKEEFEQARKHARLHGKGKHTSGPEVGDQVEQN